MKTIVHTSLNALYKNDVLVIRLERKKMIKKQPFVFSRANHGCISFLYYGPLWLGAASGCAQSNQLAGKNTERKRSAVEEQGEMKSNTWVSVFSQTAFIPSRSIWTSKLHQHMPNRQQLPNRNLKRENVHLSVYVSTVCVWVCGVWCASTDLSVSLCICMFQHSKHNNSIKVACCLLWSLIIQPCALLQRGFTSPSILSLALVPLLLSSSTALPPQPPVSHFHLPSLSSIFPLWQSLTFLSWWQAKARLASSFCSCWSPASSDSPGVSPKLSSRLLIIQLWTVLSSLFSSFPAELSLVHASLIYFYFF